MNIARFSFISASSLDPTIMKFPNVTLLIIGLGASLVQSQGYSSECTDLSLIDAWLIGTCPTDDGTGEITSSVYLPNKIENSQGTLKVC